MKQTVQIYCKNINIYKDFPVGSTLLDISKEFDLKNKFDIISAKVNNKTEGLKFRVYNNKDVEFLDATNPSAMRTYIRSLCFILYKAIREIYPDSKLRVEHPVSKGYFCNLDINHNITEEDVLKIKSKMEQIVKEDIKFHRIQVHTEDAIRIFQELGMIDKVKLLETSGSLYTYYYDLDGTIDYYYGNLVPSTGFIKVFDLIKYHDGVLLRIPNKYNPNEVDEFVKQDKMFEIFKQQVEWNFIMGVRTVGDINIANKKGYGTNIINIAEALQEKRIVQIADDIHKRGVTDDDRIKLILISGPSSSGKTTFSKRLSIQLMTNRIRPIAISLDDYFLERVDTPKTENGDYDYESFYALDLKLFENHLQALMNGEEISMPSYNFETGKKEYKGRKLKLESDTVLILEGIHALNPDLTPHISRLNKYMIYVSALTTIALDAHNWIPTTDNRLLRRIIRDYNYRGYSAEDTIMRWKSVREGEDKWIFPFQENADAMFNSALLFELATLRKYAIPILSEVPRSSEAFAEAYRLSKFLQYFVSIPDNEIPPTSLLREFLGGSSFKY